MKKIIVILFLLTSLCVVKAQQEHSFICSITPDIDLDNNADANIKKVFECWSGYLESNPDSLYNNPYWNTVDKQKYVSYDLLKSEGWLSPGLYGFKWLKNLVISITAMGDSYQVRSLFLVNYFS